MTDIEHALSITGSAYCGGCGQDWPCQYERLCEERDAAINGQRMAAALQAQATGAMRRMESELAETKVRLSVAERKLQSVREEER
jgi:hypothetical protein